MTAGSLLGGAQVLIVEDEYLLADDLVRALKKAGGDPVGPVSTIAQAEELVKTQSIDAAIVDVNLRGEMASEFIKRLAATSLPCLIVSGYASDALPECLGHVARLEKPINPASVIRALARELDRTN